MEKKNKISIEIITIAVGVIDSAVESQNFIDERNFKMR